MSFKLYCANVGVGGRGSVKETNLFFVTRAQTNQHSPIDSRCPNGKTIGKKTNLIKVKQFIYSA